MKIFELINSAPPSSVRSLDDMERPGTAVAARSAQAVVPFVGASRSHPGTYGGDQKRFRFFVSQGTDAASEAAEPRGNFPKISPTPVQTTCLSKFPHELLTEIAGLLDPDSRNMLRQTDKRMAAVGAAAVKHVKVFNSDHLEHALTSFRIAASTELTLEGESFTNEDLQKLPQSLHRLNLLSCNQITNAGLGFLRKMPLKQLALVGCDQITDAGLAHLEGLPLQQLNLSGCYQITGTGLAHLKGMPLQQLDFSRCYQIADGGLVHLAGMPLQQLDLADCSLITDVGLGHLQQMPLQQLQMFNCRLITDAGLTHLHGMPLQQLELAACDQITDAGLVHLQGMPLQRLDLSGCDQINDAGLVFLQSMPLQKLDLTACGHITDVGLAHFSENVVVN